MDIKILKRFLNKNLFHEDNRTGFFEKTVDGVKNRYKFIKDGIYLEVRRNESEDWQLLAYGNIKKIYINDDGKIEGLTRNRPQYN